MDVKSVVYERFFKNGYFHAGSLEQWDFTLLALCSCWLELQPLKLVSKLRTYILLH